VKKISVVIPCYNEEDVLPQLFQRLATVAETWAMDYEIIRDYALALPFLRAEFRASGCRERRTFSRDGRRSGDH
jgi:hypothetical protein